MINIPNSLTEIAKSKLRHMIVTNELKFGQRIAENTLSTQFGVSKTPIREALVQLKKEGLVEIYARRGTFVFSPDTNDLNCIVEARWLIEEGALRLAYKKNYINLVRSLGKVTKQMTKAAERQINLSEYLKLDIDFHRTILECADNPYFLTAYKNIATKVSALRYRLSYDQSFLDRSTQGHLAIYICICEHNLNEALQLLTDHISRAFQKVELSPLIPE